MVYKVVEHPNLLFLMDKSMVVYGREFFSLLDTKLVKIICYRHCISMLLLLLGPARKLKHHGTITVQHKNKIDKMNIQRVKPFEEDLDNN
jgi:hypothetical protein